MLRNPDYSKARDLLLSVVQPVGKESISIADCGGRVLAENICAAEHVPPFDRSPYDGYAFRSADVMQASREKPVTLEIIEEVPAGAVPTKTCTEGTAVKILTGAPIPEGADAVAKYEVTEFTEKEVRIFFPAKPGENIVRTGEDVKKGEILAQQGCIIDPGVAGTLAAQGISEPKVYRIPKVGILSIGNEIVEVGEEQTPGKIYNSNRHTLAAALKKLGCESVYLRLAGDSVSEISRILEKGLCECDAILATGGVSVGDYDFTPEAMELAGIRILFRGVDLKPGMACAYGEKDGKLVCALSGNPASSLTNFYAVAAPALKKLAGHTDTVSEELTVVLQGGFKKKSPVTRLLRGKLVFTNGMVGIKLLKDQGNVVLSSSIGCDVMAIVPAGSEPLADGTILKGFRI